MATSKRHHYIPQFYLKGFLNESNKFYVFDKVSGEIRKSIPLNSFFENHRNTGTIGNKKLTILEEMYSHFENDFAVHLEKIKLVSKLDEILPETFVNTVRFITFLFWRIPDNDEKIERIISEQTFAEAGFDLIDKKTGKGAVKELQEEMKNIDMFRKMYRIIIPISSFLDGKWKSDNENWRIYTRGNRNNLTGDNPIIIEKFINSHILDSDLLFPLSSNKCLIHTKRPKPEQLPREFMFYVDLLILEQSKRFVCCSDKEYLETLINHLYRACK